MYKNKCLILVFVLVLLILMIILCKSNGDEKYKGNLSYDKGRKELSEGKSNKLKNYLVNRGWGFHTEKCEEQAKDRYEHCIDKGTDVDECTGNLQRSLRRCKLPSPSHFLFPGPDCLKYAEFNYENCLRTGRTVVRCGCDLMTDLVYSTHCRDN